MFDIADWLPVWFSSEWGHSTVFFNTIVAKESLRNDSFWSNAGKLNLADKEN